MEMIRNYSNIYNYLLNLDELTEEDYNSLVFVYGDVIVDSVIDEMIQKNENNLDKFSYYVERKMEDIDGFSSSNLDIYMKELGASERLSKKDNIRYSEEAYNIVSELKTLFEEIFNDKYVNQDGIIFNSIVDQVDFYLEKCDDVDLYNKIVELRDRYIVVRNKLVTGNLRLVVAALKQYYTDNESFTDIIQNGNIGLMRAVEKYDPNYKTLFITYAYYWIRQSVRNSVKNANNISINVSYRAIEDNNSKLNAINILTNTLGRNPTNEEICLYMGISDVKLDSLDVAFRDTISLYSTVQNYGLGTRDVLLIDVIEDRSINVEEEVCSKVSYLQFINYLRQHLSEKQVKILLYRYGFYGELMTFRQIGEILDMTRQAVEVSEKRALTRIRSLSRKKVRDYL